MWVSRVIYVDGSALSLFLPLARDEAARGEADAWTAWADRHSTELVTTSVALAQLRREASVHDFAAREVAREIALHLPVVGVSDQAVEVATVVEEALSPFDAVHVGTAFTHPRIGGLATYDRAVAQVARMYAVPVITPGRPDDWWA